MPGIGIGISPVLNPYSFGGRTPVEIGTIINNDLVNWVYFGTGSAVFNPSDITMSGGNAPYPGISSLGLKSNLITSLENSQFVVQIQMSSSPGAGIGFVEAVSGQQGSSYSLLFGYSNPGQLLNLFEDSFVGNSFPTLLNFTSGDIIEFTVNRSYNQIQVIAENITDPDSITLNHATSNVFGGPADDRSYSGATNLYILNYQGTNKVLSISYSSTDWKYADLIFVGTSKTAGFYAGTKADRFTDIYSTATTKKINNFGTSSGTTATALLQVDEIIDLAPLAVVLEIGCNDIRNGVPELTWQTNYNNIISQLESAGITVYNHHSIPENGLDVSALTTFINTKNNVIPVAGFNVGTMLCADNVHPNAIGNIWIAANLQSYIT